MNYSLVLLTAGWMAGQSVNAATEADNPPPPALAAQEAAPAAPAKRPGLFTRLHQALHPEAPKTVQRPQPPRPAPAGTQARIRPQATAPDVVAIEVQAAPGPVIQAAAFAPEPTPEDPAASVQTVSFKPQTAADKKCPEVRKEYQDRVGCAEDYSWITGQLAYMRTLEGGVWVLWYASPGQQDAFNGSVVLAPNLPMKNYRDGDLVSVTGGILSEGGPGRTGATTYRLGGAIYRPETINIIERVDP